jgi:uncharacterized protein YraI
MKNILTSSAAIAVVLLASSTAFAQTAVTATTDLNVRAGPGPEYPIVGSITANGEATLSGCLENSKWCQVSAAGAEGWAYSDYLIADNAGTQIVVTERPAEMIPVATYEASTATGAGAISGAATGAVAGALVAGPIGAAVGTVAGAATGGLTEGVLTDPDPQLRTYVVENEVEPVYLEGEVVVGAGVPDTVEIREIPDYDYRYAYINGQPVVIEPESRRIVYIVR